MPRPIPALPGLALSLLCGVAAAQEPAPKRQNRLAQEQSPYLRQHARNPVDNWSAEWMYIFNGFAVVTCWTLIKLMLTHGFVENPYESLMAEHCDAAGLLDVAHLLRWVDLATCAAAEARAALLSRGRPVSPRGSEN